jgi:multidrug efflux pump subunit AcrB
MTRLSLRNPIAILMISIAVMVFAAVVAPRMPVDTFPELTPPVLVVGTQVPGLGASDMERTITWRIEKYVAATPGVDHVESISRNGLSIAYVWMRWGTDLNAAQTLVQQQVAFAMAAVPRSLGVIPPFVLQYDPSNAPVIQVVVRGGGLTGAQIYDFAQNVVEPTLEGISGVASAAPDGGRLRQINIVVDPVAAEGRGVTSADIAAAVAEANALLPGGAMITPGFHANVYTNAVPEAIAALSDTVVSLHDGHPILLRDVAQVQDGGAAETQSVSVDGNDAVYLNVLRVPGGNVLEIVAGVNQAIGSLRGLPPGVEVIPVFDQSTFVRDAYQGLQTEVVQALVLIALVILLFLQSFRGTLVVAIAIPLSFAVTLMVLAASGQSLNSFTLGGLTLAMGRLVDDAVVVLESIHRHRHMGKSAYSAARDGAEAVALPVLASTLTTIAVLLPIVLLEGLARRLFVPLALTVAVAMIASYAVSMYVTPVATRYLLAKEIEPGPIARTIERAIHGLVDVYVRTLRRVLPFRMIVIGASVLLVALSSYWALRLPSTFFPEVDESMEMIYVRFVPGTSLESASRQMREMGQMLRREIGEDVRLVVTNVGMPGNARAAITSPNSGPHMGFIRLALTDPEERTRSQRAIADVTRHLLTEHYPGIETLQWPGGLVASVFANGFTAPIVVEVSSEDLAQLDMRAHDIARVMRGVPGVRDVRVTLEADYPEVHVDSDRQQAGLVGLTSRDAAQTVLDGTLGDINTPGVWIDPNNGQSYYVVTYYDPTRVPDVNSLAALPVRASPDAPPVLLGTYARVQRDVGPVAVERSRLARVAHVYAQTEERDIGSATAEIEERLHADARTRRLEWRWVGQVELMRTTFGGLGGALALAVMVVFMIMASQFKSIRLPIVMLFTIPVSLFGIVVALLAAGQGFSITALMGVLMVIGIAVSNGILMVDDANVRMERGATPVTAILGAARTRFVPILMTSLATVIGLIPGALGLEAASAANRPLALAVVGGLTSSTILSLFLVPVMFTLIAPRKVARDEEDDAQAAHHAHAPSGAHG